MAVDSMAVFLPEVRNIIFDLGGVLYGVDYRRTERALAALQRHDGPEVPVFSRTTQPECITLYETGRIGADEFRALLRRDCAIDADDTALDEAWCAILTGMYPGRAELIEQLQRHYRLALLSNTNDMHIDVVRRECPELLKPFHGWFYSHELQLRKPQPEIFTHVLNDMGFRAEETLFLDDSPQHIAAAASLGIHTVWVRHPEVVDMVADILMQRTAEQHSSEAGCLNRRSNV